MGVHHASVFFIGMIIAGTYGNQGLFGRFDTCQFFWGKVFHKVFSWVVSKVSISANLPILSLPGQERGSRGEAKARSRGFLVSFCFFLGVGKNLQISK